MGLYRIQDAQLLAAGEQSQVETSGQLYSAAGLEEQIATRPAHLLLGSKATPVPQLLFGHAAETYASQ